MGKFCVAAAATVLLWQPATAIAQKAAPPPTAQMGRDMEAVMADAQAKAKRPDDEALICDALQDQIIANTTDPAVQAVVAKQGAQAQAQMDKLNEARSKQSKASVAAQIATGFASGFVPGLGAASMAAQAAQYQGAQAQAAANMQQMMSNMQEMMTIMPQMMRGQRLYELAQGKKCAWVNGPIGDMR